jgi:hypothetical protein
VSAGDEQSARAAHEAHRALVVRRDSTIDLALRPAARVDGAVDARVVVRMGDAAPRPWAGSVDVAPTGAVRLRGGVGEAFAPWNGEGRIVVVIARKGQLPEIPELASPSVSKESSDAPDHGSWRSVEIPVSFAAP